ncbi:CheR family methyltransferase [Pseudomonas sp. BN102]|uniref:CheR family methyltransferase n=1 Tax=Pseudomonas sp. BN102 TaxID=2567886 RepID=UPI002453B163|nr:CheR family methyltransferase [Pseudomonas sp. BN102]
MDLIEPICSARVLEVLLHKVHQHLGLDFSGARRSELLRRFRLLALEQGQADLPTWLEALAFAEWDEAQVQALTPVFTVGETYFRRDAEAFDWLARQHLGPLITRRREQGYRHLRIWSAACCTGEEAYSLLFLLDDLLGKDRSSWSIELFASDLNQGFLDRAEQGRYGQNAFRRNEDEFRQRYFQAEGRYWRVKPAWRGRIRFFRHNLVQGRLPNAEKGLAELDLILCRNVLMYFSPEQSAGALRRLLSCLTAEGLLLLSAVEAGLATQAGFNGFWAGSNCALRAGSRLPHRPAVTPPLPRVEQPFLWQPVSAPQAKWSEATPPPSAPELPQQRGCDSLWQRARQALEQGRHPQSRKILLEYLASSGLTQAERHQACLLMVRSWADEQRGDDADSWLQRALALDPTSATAHWLAAMLAQQAGDEPATLVALQKVLYLDPEFILAHFHLARLLRARGQQPASDKALRNCRELLGRLPPEAPVPEGDGLSCVQLLRLCEQLMEAKP